jgi:hypothetical protein
VSDLSITVRPEEGDHQNYPIAEVLALYGWDGVERGWTDWRKTHCPFHVDNTPSGAVNHQLNSYRCFSCGAAGNSVTLVMKIEGIDQNEAVRKLKGEVNGTAPVKSEERVPWEQRSRPSRIPPWESFRA